MSEVTKPETKFCSTCRMPINEEFPGFSPSGGMRSTNDWEHRGNHACIIALGGIVEQLVLVNRDYGKRIKALEDKRQGRNRYESSPHGKACEGTRHWFWRGRNFPCQCGELLEAASRENKS